MLNQETKAILVEGKAIINNPDQWGKCANARNEEGNGINPISPKACRWCAFGTLNKARYDGNYSIKALNNARRELANAIEPLTDRGRISGKFGLLFGIITGFNDAGRVTHADVIEAFNEAIENCE